MRRTNVKIEIDTRGIMFVGGPHRRASKVAEILRDLARRIEHSGDLDVLLPFDTNGVDIGSVEITEEERKHES